MRNMVRTCYSLRATARVRLRDSAENAEHVSSDSPDGGWVRGPKTSSKVFYSILVEKLETTGTVLEVHEQESPNCQKQLCYK